MEFKTEQIRQKKNYRSQSYCYIPWFNADKTDIEQDKKAM